MVYPSPAFSYWLVIHVVLFLYLYWMKLASRTKEQLTKQNITLFFLFLHLTSRKCSGSVSKFLGYFGKCDPKSTHSGAYLQLVNDEMHIKSASKVILLYLVYVHLNKYNTQQMLWCLVSCACDHFI